MVLPIDIPQGINSTGVNPTNWNAIVNGINNLKDYYSKNITFDVTHEDYGATGDGVTDDTSALQTAITAAGVVGGKVFFPVGNYLISTALDIPSNVMLEGIGKVSKVFTNTNNINILNILSRVNVIIKNLMLEGNQTSSDIINGNLIYCNVVTDLMVENCFFNKSGYAGINLYNEVTDFIIENNEFTNGVGNASESDILGYTLAKNGSISDNRCYSTNSQGIFVNANTDDSNTRVIGNFCKNHSRHGIEVCYVGGSQITVVSGNICRDNGWTGIYIQGVALSADMVVDGNICADNGASGSGSLGGNIVAVADTESYGIIISNNLCIGNLHAAGADIMLIGKNVAVLGNTCRGSISQGIRIYASSSDMGNYYKIECNTIDSAAVYGIYVSGGAGVMDAIRLSMNTILGCGKGIYFNPYDGVNGVVSNNTIKGLGITTHGIDVLNVINSSIMNNTIDDIIIDAGDADSGVGIKLWTGGVTYSIIEGNYLTNCDRYGIWYYSSYCTFVSNYYKDNGVNIVYEGGTGNIAGLTPQLTTITHTSPGSPDYAIQDLVQNTGFGFVTKDEGNSLLAVIANLQVRVAELEVRL